MSVRCAVLDDPAGREQLVTVAKLSWAVSPDGIVALLHPPAPVRFSGTRRDGAGSSLLYPDDLVQFRPGTDVVMIGTAHPPPKDRGTSMDVTLRVGNKSEVVIDKTVRVYGPRVWQKGLTGVAPGPPAALVPTPLIYESSYGGHDDSVESDDQPYDHRNPVGTGVAADPATLLGEHAPAIEHPDHPLRSRHPAPACFGPIPSHWEPLVSHGGTYDDAWQRERAPIRPLDFDPRFDGCAPDDQHAEAPLVGDEIYEVRGVLESGKVWRFQLPLYRPTFFAKRRDREDDEKLSTHLDTVLIDADEGTVELTWRASVRLPVVPQLLEWVRVGSSDPLPSQINDQIMAIGRAARDRS
jgi:hypothetical protein